jgi:hypothetical protein
MNNAVFLDVPPCGSCKNGRFGRTYHLQHKGEKNRRARKNKYLASEACCEENISSKRRFLFDPHSDTSQKTAFFVVTAVKTSNLT